MQQDCAQKTDSSLSSWWLKLIRDRRWSASQKRQLIESFKCPALVLGASFEQTRAVITGKQRNAASLVDQQSIEDDLTWLADSAHHLIPIHDSRYPPLLRQLTDPPLALFAIGNIDLLKEPQVAIVGSRKPTPIGDKLTRSISKGLANLGIIITSGMALGVDGAAHQGALSSGAPSIAVLGNGLDTIYPSRHRELYQQLSSTGLLISEYPLGVKPDRYTFPQRNRIVSGLCYGVVIVEAAKRSGTLITARLALEQNREVMVVPGSALSSQYSGSHQLIKQGAALVCSPEDVVHCLSEPLSRFLPNPVSIDANETLVGASDQHPLLRYISTESTSVDDIILGSQLTSAEVSSMLLELELVGVVAIANDGGYVNLS